MDGELLGQEPWLIFPLLETRRLQLRRFNAEDAAALFKIESVPEQHPLWHHRRFRNLSQAEHFIRESERRHAHQVGVTWGLVLKEAQELVGWIQIRLWVDRDGRTERYGHRMNLECFLAHPQRGQGLMPEAWQRVIPYAFAVFPQVYRLESLAASNDPWSLRLHEKTGFQAEGLIRAFESYRSEDGIRHLDMVSFSLLRLDLPVLTMSLRE